MRYCRHAAAFMPRLLVERAYYAAAMSAPPLLCHASSFTYAPFFAAMLFTPTLHMREPAFFASLFSMLLIAPCYIVVIFTDYHCDIQLIEYFHHWRHCAAAPERQREYCQGAAGDKIEMAIRFISLH